nr:hypothetical protein [Tanacetum cinerariifolium]
MNNKKHIVNLESFRDMLLISPRIPGQSFDELPFEEEILEFISFRLSQAQILWGLYHTRNIDYAFLIWEDFMYQVERNNHKKSNEMYYPRFTKVIIHHFMSKDLSIPRRNKVNWHYVRDDFLFSMIKVVSRHQNTQQYGAMLPIELTNDEIRNTKAYKEYYAFATGEAAPKPKVSARRKRSGSDTSITPPTATTTPKPTVAVTQRLIAAAKGKQTAKSLYAPSESGGSGTDEGTGSKPGVPDVPTDESEEELSWNSSDDEGVDDQEKVGNDDEGDEGDESNEGEEDSKMMIKKIKRLQKDSFDPIPKTPKGSEDEGDGEEDQGLNIGEEERLNEEEEAEELYKDVDINQGRGLQVNQEVEDSHVTLTPINSDGQHESSSVSLQFVTNMLNPTSDAGMESIFVTASTFVTTLPITAPTMTLSTVATITTTSQAQIPPTPILSEVLQNLPTFDSVFRFDDRLRTVDENIKKIIKEQVKDQVKAQVSKILPRIEQAVNEQLEAEVLTRSSHSSRTSYAVAADLSEMELNKILIEKMEGNKSIQYWGSKRRREGKEPESASTPLETATRSAGRSTTGSKSRQASASESAFTEEPVQTTSQMDEPSYPVFKTGADDQPIV